MLKFQDDYTTRIATFEDFILLLLMTCIKSSSPFLFHKGEMCIPQKCLIWKLLPCATVASLLGWIPKMLGIPL